MVNPDGPPMSGSQSRAKGSSIALVLPVEYSTASWRRALLSLEEHQKAWLLWELQRQYPLGSTRDDHPVGMGAIQQEAGRRTHCEEDCRSPSSTYLAGRAGCQSRAGRAGDV